MNKKMIYKMVNGEWEYVISTNLYVSAKIMCEKLNKKGYNAKITDSKGIIIRYFLID